MEMNMKCRFTLKECIDLQPIVSDLVIPVYRFYAIKKSMEAKSQTTAHIKSIAALCSSCNEMLTEEDGSIFICSSCQDEAEPKIYHAIRQVAYIEDEHNKNWKKGFITDGGTGPLIDMNGEPVKMVHDYIPSDFWGEVLVSKENGYLVIRLKEVQPPLTNDLLKEIKPPC